VIAFLGVIYMPRLIWDQEEAVEAESRFYMENVYDVLSYYERLTGERTADGQWAIKVVNAARDSLTADTTFLSKQKIHLDGGTADVDMFANYTTVYDTSFGFLKTRKDTLLDTVIVILFESLSAETSMPLALVSPVLALTVFTAPGSPVAETATSQAQSS